MPTDVTRPTDDEVRFVREERFIVIKRKRLTEHTERAIRALLRRHNIPTSECVVVEADWPEYETVWQMIEARCTGRTTPQPHIAAEPGEDGPEEWLRRLIEIAEDDAYSNEYVGAEVRGNWLRHLAALRQPSTDRESVRKEAFEEAKSQLDMLRLAVEADDPKAELLMRVTDIWKVIDNLAAQPHAGNEQSDA